MKKKICKLLSVLLAAILIFSACTCAIGTASATTEKEYYVKAGASGGDGSQAKPFATVTDAITAANASAGLVAGDTLNIIADGDISWGSVTTPEHAYGIVVKSNTTTPSKLTIANETKFGGKTTLDNIAATTSDKTLFLNLHDFTLTKTASLDAKYFLIGRAGNSRTVENQTVIIDGSLNVSKEFGLGNDWNNVTYTGSLNITINDPAHKFDIYFGCSKGMANYSNVKIDIKAASGVDFKAYMNGSTPRHDFSNGFLQIINSSATALTLDYSALANIADSKKLIINNTLGLKGLVSFTDTNGKFAVGSGYQNIKANNGSSDIPAESGFLNLAAGAVYSITADKVPENKTFYVKAGATEGEGTVQKPYGNIKQAVQAGIDAGLVVNDTLTLKLMGEDEIDWADVSGHRYKLIVDSADVAQKSTIKMAAVTLLNGEVAFENVKIRSDEYHSSLYFGNNNITFASGTEFGIRHVIFGVESSQAQVVGVDVVFNCAVVSSGSAGVSLTNDWSDKTYTGDINVTVNNASAAPSFKLATKNGVTNYQNINFDIKNANSVGFTEIATYITTGSYVINGAIQILNSSATQITAKTGELVNIAADKKYIVNNISGDSNLLSLTETIGKYKVASQYQVYAVKEGTTDRIYPVGDYLVLDAGQYTVNVDRPSVEKIYYVSSNGIEIAENTRPATAGTKENPVLTIADATRLVLQDGLSKIDTAKIVVNVGDIVKWGKNAVACSPLLVIQSSVEGENATVYEEDNLILPCDMVFKDITLEMTGEYKIFCLNNKNVTFDTGSNIIATYVGLGGINGAIAIEPINLVFKGSFNPRSFEFTSNYGSSTYKSDINVIVDSQETAFVPEFGGKADTTTKYEGNINITVLNAKTLSMKTSLASERGQANIIFDGGLQLVVDKNVTFPYAVKKNFESIEVGGGKWYITNNSDIADLINFTDTTGKFSIKDNKKVYIRNAKDNVMTTNSTGAVSLPSGQYVISDKEVPEILNESHKMLHYVSAGGSGEIHTRTLVEAGKTYRFEYCAYAIRYDSFSPRIGADGNRQVLTKAEIISEKKIGNYYKVLAEFTVPIEYESVDSDYVFVGFTLGTFDEGYVFDMKVYEAGDSSKTNVMQNSDLHNGLDEWAITWSFWGNHWAGEKGGSGVVNWTNGSEALDVVNYDLKLIDELIAAADPQDGEWWQKDWLHEEEIYTGYAVVKGVLKDHNGTAIKNTKLSLISNNYTYTVKTNAKGEFIFKNIVVDFYELYILKSNGEKVNTGYSVFAEDGATYTLNIVTDLSGVGTTIDSQQTQSGASGDYETIEDGDNVDEIKPTGSLSGTVYTPYLETVSELKLLIDGVGEVVTDENGNFAFANIPIGQYDLYTILDDGSKYVLKTVSIVENAELSLKLKYAPPAVEDTDSSADNGWIIWVIIASVVALIVVAGLVILLVIKKKKYGSV